MDTFYNMSTNFSDINNISLPQAHGFVNNNIPVYPEDRITEDQVHFWSIMTGYVMLFVIAVGGALNAVVLVTFRRHRTLINSNNQLLVVLFILDSTMLAFSFPFICVSCLLDRWVFGDIGCQWYGASMTVLGLSSIWTLTVVAMQRFASIVLIRKSIPSQYASLRTLRITIAIVLYSLAVASLPFFGIGKYSLEVYVYSCTPTWWERSVNNIAFLATIFISAFVIPVFIIVVCYTGILVKVYNLPLNTADTKRKVKMAVMTITLIFMFLLSWGAYALVAVLIMFKSDFELTPMSNGLPVMMAKSCVLWNPIIYGIGDKKFRAAVIKDAKDFFSRCSSVLNRSKSYTLPTSV